MINVISGLFKNSLLNFPIYLKKKNFKTTPKHIKKSVFDFLGCLKNYYCLDLFSGSGGFGFEAASRNCKMSILFEKNKRIFFYLKNNFDKLNFRNIKIYNCDFFFYLKNKKHLYYYDLIFIDSPYINFNKLIYSLNFISYFLKKGSYLYIETIIDVKIILKKFIYKFKILKNNFFNKINYIIFEVL